MINLTYNPVADAIRNDEENEAWIATRPTCCICGEPITDDYLYEFGDGDVWCESCINDLRMYVDTYMESRA